MKELVVWSLKILLIIFGFVALVVAIATLLLKYIEIWK